MPKGVPGSGTTYSNADTLMQAMEALKERLKAITEREHRRADLMRYIARHEIPAADIWLTYRDMLKARRDVEPVKSKKPLQPKKKKTRRRTELIKEGG